MVVCVQDRVWHRIVRGIGIKKKNEIILFDVRSLMFSRRMFLIDTFVRFVIHNIKDCYYNCRFCRFLERNETMMILIFL